MWQGILSGLVVVLPWAKKGMKKLLKKKIDEKQVVIVALINKKLDIPKMDETQEAKLYNQVYDILQEIIETTVLD